MRRKAESCDVVELKDIESNQTTWSFHKYNLL